MVNWDLIDNVFLDMDGTLLDLHFDNYFWLEHLPNRYAEIQGCSAKSAREYLVGEYGKLRGKLDWYCLEYWQEQLQIDIVALKKEIVEKIRLRPQAHEFLMKINQAGKHVALVSNAHPWSISLKLETALPREPFHAIHSSHEFGFPKEEQLFWKGLNERSAFDPSRTLFIDDNEQVLESAERYGIAHLLSIDQPDMESAPLTHGRYRQINKFSDLI